jgi:serine/threonine protein kinase
VVRKCPSVPPVLLDLLEDLLSPDPKDRPSIEQTLERMSAFAECPRVRPLLQSKLQGLKENCLEHQVRKRLIAKRMKNKKSCVPKHTSGTPVRETRLLNKKPDPSGAQLNSSLKRVKT